MQPYSSASITCALCKVSRPSGNQTRFVGYGLQGCFVYVNIADNDSFTCVAFMMARVLYHVPGCAEWTILADADSMRHVGALALDNLVRHTSTKSDKITKDRKQKRFASRNLTSKTELYRALLTSAVSGIGHRIYPPKKTKQTEQVVSEPFQDFARKGCNISLMLLSKPYLLIGYSIIENP